MEKNCVIFVIQKLYFVNFLDLDFKFLELFGLWLDLDWVLKIQECIQIAKLDSPFISGSDLQQPGKYRVNDRLWLLNSLLQTIWDQGTTASVLGTGVTTKSGLGTYHYRLLAPMDDTLQQAPNTSKRRERRECWAWQW